MSEDEVLNKKELSHLEHVAVMTYASELFSWYAGSVEADIYFCPERHGTYFGGFYMKDYPAMNNPDYFISTTITGNSGEAFLDILDETQSALITSITEEQTDDMKRIVEIRTQVSQTLRSFMISDQDQSDKVDALMKEYGLIEGKLSSLYATIFAAVEKTLTDSQKEALLTLRNRYIFPEGSYLYSQPIDMPEIDSSQLLK